MTKLSVNLNKVATLRNARGGNVPNVLQVAKDCEDFGADGITVHPRPDGRHIRTQDVYDLSAHLRTEFNIEGYPSPDFIRLVCEVRPTQVTLVPDAPEQLTSNHGWDVKAHLGFLQNTTSRFQSCNIRVSLFIDATEEMAAAAKEAGADRVELYTGPFAAGYPTDPQTAIAPYVAAAKAARQLELGLNAGHDLSLENLAFFHRQIPWTDEVSIGHALIADALYLGFRETIRRYKACLGEPH